jgi:hypothetical protein
MQVHLARQLHPAKRSKRELACAAASGIGCMNEYFANVNATSLVFALTQMTLD